MQKIVIILEVKHQVWKIKENVYRVVLESGDVINDRNNVKQRISLDRDKGIGLDSNAGSVTLLKVVSLNFIICHM